MKKTILIIAILVAFSALGQDMHMYGDGTVHQDLYGYDSYNKQIIKENPFLISEKFKNPKQYYYNGYSDQYGSSESGGNLSIKLSYRTDVNNAGNRVSGLLEMGNSTYFIRGTYKGLGKYEAVLYKKDLVYEDMWNVRGTIVWNVSNPKKVDLKITDKSNTIDFIMENYGSR